MDNLTTSFFKLVVFNNNTAFLVNSPISEIFMKCKVVLDPHRTSLQFHRSRLMDEIYTRVAKSIHGLSLAQGGKRFLVAIAGIPGSGKTTLAKAVVERLNEMNGSVCHHAMCIPMDGFHLPRVALDQFSNREQAYARRGAPWTFDVAGFTEYVQSLRIWADGNSAKILYAPSFDHKQKDPVSDMIVEGNYLLFDEPSWRDVAPLFDYRLFVDADLEVARERVAKRHVQAGIEPNIESGFRRVDENDYLNARAIYGKRLKADLVICSIDETKISG
ncbi:hypothetical protein N7519_000980 [Penicillium mononematosum]|uniref:uncharacterized protein n=1 Tax=Penicillium mononematosum TaxID=268346 RepID=UPI00254894E5|nr:uncharacterized protein N7519_000980 [Penicillium mononematosum]KAJ6190959.1 hypothetical protein N7519_000980 [Penicillium mononematosum]